MEKIVTYKDDMTPEMTGGKFERQKRMSESGFQVPRFFCLTALYYEESFTGLRDKVSRVLGRIDFSDALSIQEASSRIAGIFQEYSFSGEQEREIYQHFDALFPGYACFCEIVDDRPPD